MLDIDKDTDEVTSQRVYSEHFSVSKGKIADFTLNAEFYKRSRDTMRALYGKDIEFSDVVTKVYECVHTGRHSVCQMYAVLPTAATMYTIHQLPQGVLNQPAGLKAFYDKLNALVGPVNKYNSGAVFQVRAPVS